MRPPKSRQSAVRTPLNRLFGAEANVRILRVFALDPHPLTRTELARRARLEPKGAHLAAERLLAEGILERVGGGPLQQVMLAEGHPLAGAIRAVFVAERQRADSLVDSLRDAAKSLSPEIDSAWVQGGFARDEDTPGEPITVAVLAPTSAAAAVTTRLRDAVTPVEAAADVTIDTSVYTRADLLTLSDPDRAALSPVLSLFGPPPDALLARPVPLDGAAARSHADREAEQQRLAEAVVAHLRRHPAKRRLALEYIRTRWKHASAGERQELEEWKAVLQSASNARLERLLTASGERATRLRQTLPFMNLLSPDERRRILEGQRDDPR